MRLGSVPYYNALPLTAALRGEVTKLPPVKLAGALLDGSLDAALVPVVDVLEHDLYAYPQAGVIACDGEVKSVGLFVRDELSGPEEIETVYWDAESRTSVALAKILLNRRYGRNLRSLKALALGHCRIADAQLLIGDKALFFQEPGYRCFDLGREWKELTGEGFLFACWASARPLKEAEFSALAEARDAGIGDLANLIARVPTKHRPVVTEYLAGSVVYHFTETVEKGYARFEAEARDLDLLPAVERTAASA